MRRVEKDLARLCPSACITSRKLSIASVVGRDLSGLSILARGLHAIADAGLEVIGAAQGPRKVDVQFVVECEALKPAVHALHGALIEPARNPLLNAA